MMVLKAVCDICRNEKEHVFERGELLPAFSSKISGELVAFKSSVFKSWGIYISSFGEKIICPECQRKRKDV